MYRPNTLLRSLTIGLVVLAFACFASVVDADTLYVNNMSGSNSSNGLSEENQGDGIGPLRTIAAALKRAERGDRIVLANTGAFYEECVTLQGARHSGTSFAPFVIEGNGATLDGTAEVPAHRWEFVRDNIFRFVPDHAGFQQLFIAGEVAAQLPRVNGAYVSNYLKGKEWQRYRGGIQFAAEKGKSVYSYDLRYAQHRVGITLYDVENVVIHDLNVRGFQLDGINAHDNAMDCILSQVSSTANGRSGVAVCGASRVRLVKSNLQQNGSVQLHMEDWSTTHLNETKMVAKYAPVWKRNLNAYGRGAKLFINEEPQVGSEGWNLPEEGEQTDLKRGLDELENQLESDNATERPLDLPATPNEAEEPGDAPEPIENIEAPAEALTPVEEETDLGEGDDPFGSDAFGDDATEEEPAMDDGDLFEDFGDGSDDDDPFGDI